MKKILFLFLIGFVGLNITVAQEVQSKEKNKEKLGFYFDNLTADQKAFNAETSGVAINRVSKNSPGALAGIQVGDILTHIDGVAVKDLDHCITLITNLNTVNGSTILNVIRNGVKMELKLKFA